MCTVSGLVLGWLPALLHGPIPQKFDVLHIDGSTAVWGWYLARCGIGFLVGITIWPKPWWIRGPMCGLMALLPLAMVSLATPGCGVPCVRANLLSAVTLGLLDAGVARWLTGRDRA